MYESTFPQPITISLFPPISSSSPFLPRPLQTSQSRLQTLVSVLLLFCPNFFLYFNRNILFMDWGVIISFHPPPSDLISIDLSLPDDVTGGCCTTANDQQWKLNFVLTLMPTPTHTVICFKKWKEKKLNTFCWRLLYVLFTGSDIIRIFFLLFLFRKLGRKSSTSCLEFFRLFISY